MAEASTSAKVRNKLHKHNENDKEQEEEEEEEDVVHRLKKKRSYESSRTGTDDAKIPKYEFSSHVARHYNELESAGIDKRKESKIFYLRNFNNWIKSILINIYSSKLYRITNVLDLCCGKGGDLHKWQKSNIRHLICADIADISVQQCRSRYYDMKYRRRNLFSCEFITADCTRVRLREKFEDPDIQFDIVSCQFSFHYCFESLPQAESMLKNASECLKIGGYFIGTVPHANEIVKRIRKSNKNILENNIFSIEMCSDEPYPIFGAQYDFHLDSVVGCPEFLVHFPTLVKLAEKYDLRLDHRSSFPDFYKTYWHDSKKQFLLKRMAALEPYSLKNRKNKQCNEYTHAEKFCKDNGYENTLGTISQSEWEVISLYQVFAFVKVRPKDSQGESNK